MRKNLDTIFNVVLGTAGHIDHGKSALVRRLTGVDPDRLPEERSRGLTIDLGFAPLTLPDGRRVGIVDVPGHERFIKNMVAGATGVDLVLLVVAADDGVMPQTLEHLAILRVLGVREGFVAITKRDLVDDDLSALVREDITGAVLGTFLEGQPIIEVSSTTGEGVEEVRAALHDCIARLPSRPEGGAFRMPVQRVFSLQGFGTVLTGVPVSGSAGSGDTLEVLPGGGRSRVRGLQAYKEPTDRVRAGHSAAVNLAEIDYRTVRRGMVLAAPGTFRPAAMLEAWFHYLPAARRPLVHRTPVRFHTGTAEVLGRVHLLETKELDPGAEGPVQLRLDEPVVTAPGDRYILRLSSPAETIGGGEILDRSVHRLKTGKPRVIARLRAKREALRDPRRFLACLIDEAGPAAPAEDELARRTGRPRAEVRADLEALEAEGCVRRAACDGHWVSAARLDEALDEARRIADAHYREHPRRLRMELHVLRRGLGGDDTFAGEVVARLVAAGEVAPAAGSAIVWRDRGPRLDATDRAIREDALSACHERLFRPPAPDELAAERGHDPGRTREIYELLAEEGELRRLAEGVWLHRDAIDEARRRLSDHLATRPEGITAADARKLLETTRKYIIPLLEALDREGFTKRCGDLRVLGGG